MKLFTSSNSTTIKTQTMKRTILILTILTVGIVHSQAQLGEYYKVIHDSYQQSIIRSDSSVIITEKGITTTWYYFTEGMCNELFIYVKGLSDRSLIELCEEEEVLTKSSKGDWWYYKLEAKNGNFYHAISELYYDDADRVFHHIYLNAKID